jgi:hypothetical protein
MNNKYSVKQSLLERYGNDVGQSFSLLFFCFTLLFFIRKKYDVHIEGMGKFPANLVGTC